MPAVTEVPRTDLRCHCPDPRCPGTTQEIVPGTVQTLALSNVELGGDIPGLVERTMDSYHFANEDDIPCPHCGKDREISNQERPAYAAVSGQPQDELLTRNTGEKRTRELEFAAQLQEAKDAKRDAEMAEMRAGMAALQAQNQALLAQTQPAPTIELGGAALNEPPKPERQKPGPKPKAPEVE